MHTLVDQDKDHKKFRARARDALLSGTLEWRHHGIGVLQAYISEGRGVEHRLHIWSKSLIKPGIDASGDAHDHRFDMVSHVLHGTIVNEEWHLHTTLHAGRLQVTTMQLVNARAAGGENNYHAPMTPTGVRYSLETQRHTVDEGQKYRFPAQKFHRNPVQQFAITWVEKHNQTNTPARIAHPIDISAVPAFGHAINTDQVDFLTTLAAEVLRDA